MNKIPFMLEHLNSQEDYELAADYVRQTGKREGIGFAVSNGFNVAKSFIKQNLRLSE